MEVQECFSCPRWRGPIRDSEQEQDRTRAAGLTSAVLVKSRWVVGSPFHR